MVKTKRPKWAEEESPKNLLIVFFSHLFSSFESPGKEGERELLLSFDLPMEEQMGGSEDRWKGSLENITEMASNLDSLQKLLLKKAVFVEEDTFSRASLVSEQARTIKVRLKKDSPMIDLECVEDNWPKS